MSRTYRDRDRYDDRDRPRESREERRYRGSYDDDNRRDRSDSPGRRRDDHGKSRNRRHDRRGEYSNRRGDYDRYNSDRANDRDPLPDKHENTKKGEDRGLLEAGGGEKKWYTGKFTNGKNSGKLVYAEGESFIVKVGEEEKHFWATILEHTEEGLLVTFDAGPLKNRMLLKESDGVIPPHISEKITSDPDFEHKLYGKPSTLKMLLCLKPQVLSIDQPPQYRPDWLITLGWTVVIAVVVLIIISG